LIMEIKHVRSMDTIGKKKLKEWESSFGKGVVEELSSWEKKHGRERIRWKENIQVYLIT
jgi:hypothetical protein